MNASELSSIMASKLDTVHSSSSSVTSLASRYISDNLDKVAILVNLCIFLVSCVIYVFMQLLFLYMCFILFSTDCEPALYVE